MCKTKISIKAGLSYTIHSEDKNHYTGRNYLIIHDNDVDNYDIRVSASINRHIDLGQLSEYKMDGASPLYLVSHLQKLTTGKSQIYIDLINCDNCVVCASLHKPHPRIIPFSNDTNRNIDCDTIVGRIMNEDDKPYKTYNRTALVDF